MRGANYETDDIVNKDNSWRESEVGPILTGIVEFDDDDEEADMVSSRTMCAPPSPDRPDLMHQQEHSRTVGQPWTKRSNNGVYPYSSRNFTSDSFASQATLTPIPSPSTSTPWNAKNPIQKVTLLPFLHDEIIAMVRYLAPTPVEHLIREFIIGRIRRAVHEQFGSPFCCDHYPNEKEYSDEVMTDGEILWGDILPYGSFKDRTYCPTSDINLDLVINFHEPLAQTMNRVTSALLHSKITDSNKILSLPESDV